MKFEIRAVQIDLARQIETVDSVKKFFDVAAESGLNTVVMYLEDRVKTATYPYSEDVDSYSPEQIKELVAYADKLGLDLIPVVSPIGHTERFLRHPQLKHLAELRGDIPGMFAKGIPGEEHMDTCPKLEENLAFFDKYITEVAQLFPSKYFHIGFDEIHEMGFCELCKGTPIAELFADAVKHFHALLTKLGKEVMIWDDMLEQQPQLAEMIPNDIILCAWFYRHTGQYPIARFDTSRAYDYLTAYERLGFRTIASPWRSASLETLTTYAAKCNTMGMLQTNWEMSDHQQLAMLHPVMTYAGSLWSGKELPGNDALVKAAAQYTDTPEAAKALAAAMSSMHYTGAPLPNKNTKYPIEVEYNYTMKNLAPLLIETLSKATGDRDVLDAYLIKLRMTDVRLRLWEIGYELHEFRAGVGALTAAEIHGKATAMEPVVEALAKDMYALWDRLRPGIPYTKQLIGAATAIKDSVAWLVSAAETAKANEIGRLVVRFDLEEFTAACTTCVTVHYADGSTYEAARGNYKALYVQTEKYDYSFEIPADKEPAAVTLTVSGYGAVGFRYVSANVNGKEYVPAAVAAVSGQVEHAEFMLADDSRTSMFNEQEMQQFFTNDISGKREHSVTLSMKPW